MDLNAIHKKIMKFLYQLKNSDTNNDGNILADKILYSRNNPNEINSFDFTLVCKNCCSIPVVKFLDFSKIKCECACLYITNIDPEYYLRHFSLQLNTDLNKTIENNNNFCICKKHFRNYVSYCDDCSCDICEECLYDITHLNHILFRFPNICDKLKNIIFNYINKQMKKIDNDDIKENISSMIKFMKSIILSYEANPCFISYKNLYNLFNFLEKIQNNEKNINKNENYRNEFFFKIRQTKDLKDFLKKYPNNKDKIKSINIQRQNFYDLNLLKTNELSISYNKLLKLELRNNNISDISPLTSINFPELKNLDISINRLSNDNIDNITEISKNCPKLEILNLFNNAFTKYKLIEVFSNFKSLKKLNIGNNLLHTDFKNIKNDNLEFEFSNIEEVGLSFGVFSKQSINLLNNFKFNNLKKLDLSSNNLISLSFVETINDIKLEEIILSDNHLKEFYKLKKFIKLKQINLKGNKISDVTKLNDLLKELNDIEKLILSENNIDLNIMQNDEIIEKAKKQRNSMNNKIQIII